jgi:hypothetical protein
MRFTYDFSSSLFLIPFLVSIVHLLPLVAVLVNHEEAVVVRVVVVRVVDRT